MPSRPCFDTLGPEVRLSQAPSRPRDAADREGEGRFAEGGERFSMRALRPIHKHAQTSQVSTVTKWEIAGYAGLLEGNAASVRAIVVLAFAAVCRG